MTAMAIRNRAARRAARRRDPTHDQLMFWADREEAKAREQGRDLPSAALHPDDVPTDVFPGAANAIGRKPPLVRFRHCLVSAREALRAGDLRGGEAALRMGCSLLPRDDEDIDAFKDASGGDDALDALEFALWAVEDGNAVRALGLLTNYLDRRVAA